jgi:hypothetical protein
MDEIFKWNCWQNRPDTVGLFPARNLLCRTNFPVLTDGQAKHFARELTKRCASDSLEKQAGGAFREINIFV